MDPSAAAAAGVDLAGGLASSAFSLVQAGRQNRFQENMSNTAHQREVQDLQKAGLNPILSVNHGASTPSGAMAPPPDISRIGSSYNSARATSVAQAQQKSQADVNAATVRKINADASVSEQTAENLKKTSPFQNAMPESQLGLLQNELFRSDATINKPALRAILDKVLADASSSQSRAELLKLEIPKAANSSRAAQTTWGKYVMPYLESAKQAAGLFNTIP